MKRYARLSLNVLILVLAGLLILRLDPTGRIFNVPGLLVVLAGAYVATCLGQSFGAVWAVVRGLPAKLAAEHPGRDDEVDVELFLKAAEFYRQTNVKYAELAMRRIVHPFLKTGTALVLDRTPKADVQRMLDWRIGAQREHDQREIHIFQTMMGYAPAFGMVGTLFGLIGMLYGLDVGNLRRLGTDMGFAMLTTVYGLLLANLILKPIVTRLEQRSRERLAWLHALKEAALMMHDQAHPQLIREFLGAFLAPHTPSDQDALPHLAEAPGQG